MNDECRMMNEKDRPLRVLFIIPKATRLFVGRNPNVRCLREHARIRHTCLDGRL